MCQLAGQAERFGCAPDQTFAVQTCVNLQGKLNGLAVRVPLTNSSITDCVFEVEKATSVEEVNKLLKVC